MAQTAAQTQPRFMVHAQGGHSYLSRTHDDLEFAHVRNVAQRVADSAARAQAAYQADLYVHDQPEPGVRGELVSWYRWDGTTWSHRAGRRITGLDGRPAEGWRHGFSD